MPEKQEQQASSQPSVSVPFDTARAYATPQINYTKKSEKADAESLIDKVKLKINKTDGKNMSFSVIGKVESKIDAKPGMFDLYKYLTKNDIERLESEAGCNANVKSGFSSIYSFVSVTCPPDKIKDEINLVKKAAFEPNHTDFESAKTYLKKYYEAQFDEKTKTTKKPDDKKIEYMDFTEAKSLEDINKAIDSITPEDYNEFCKNYRESQKYTMVLTVPNEIMDKEEQKGSISDLVINNIYNLHK